ncbi:LysM peptidoglycan-binding domain-containing protein [Streptococcus troglodytae]
MKKKHLWTNVVMLGALVVPIIVQTRAVANNFYADQTNAQRADITNWVASTPEQINHNILSQNINVNHLNGERYIIQWGDTLWGISQATGISIQKLAYDNNITNVDLIYAGDILILNRDGKVPTSYTYKGTGYYCAHTSININHFYGDDNSVVIINNTSYYADNHIEHNYPVDNNENSDSQKDSTISKDDSSFAKKKTEDSSKASSNKKSANAKEKTLDEDTYQDAVQKEINKLIHKKVEEGEITFLSHDPADAEAITTKTEDLEEKVLYDQQQVQLDNVTYTERSAKEVAKKIYNQLIKDDYLTELTDAQAVQLDVEKENNTSLLFNLKVYNKSETSTTESSSKDKDGVATDSSDSDNDKNSDSTISSEQSIDSNDNQSSNATTQSIDAASDY